MSSAALADWLVKIERLHPEEIELGLTRIHRVYTQLALDKLAAKVVCVAGTNGKGSVVRALQVLLASPDNDGRVPLVGVYTSPHLLRFNERIVIGGREASDAQLCAAFERIEAARQACAGQDSPPALTYFEYTTLAALCLFSDAGLDYALLEVGLGGRLDAVNIIDADVAVITSIALDHEHWLGETRDKIAVEKAGILRERQACVIGDPQPPVALQQAVATIGAHAVWSSSSVEDFKAEKGVDSAQPSHGLAMDSKATLHWRGVDASGESIERHPLALPTLDAMNWSAALQAAALLGALPSAQRCSALMRDTQLVGRFSMHALPHSGSNDPVLRLDVAHNPAAVERLARELERDSGSPVCMVFAALADKRIDVMLRSLMPHVDHWIFPQLHNCPRALDADKMLQNFHAQGGSVNAGVLAASVGEALDAAKVYSTAANPANKPLICVSGSFFTVAEALAFIQ